MDELNNNIKKYYCKYCNNYVKILIFKSSIYKPGYMCMNCDKKMKKRLLQIKSGIYS